MPTVPLKANQKEKVNGLISVMTNPEMNPFDLLEFTSLVENLFFLENLANIISIIPEISQNNPSENLLLLNILNNPKLNVNSSQIVY